MELLAGDTRGVISRGRWPGLDDIRLGELWLHERDDGRWDLLSADDVVVVSQEFRKRLRRARHSPLNRDSWVVGSLVTFTGVRESATYWVLNFDQPHNLWLLRRARRSVR